MRKNKKYFRSEDFLEKKRPSLLFCFFEQIYKFFFFLVLFFKKNLKKSKNFNFKIISVGNLSVGGTGKSVFVQFLIKNISDKSGAIVLRGYKGQNEKTGNSLLVFDGKNFFCNPNFCGDESYMLADSLRCPVVVGKNRAKSCTLLMQKKLDLNLDLDLDFVVLDDAYQNFAVKKDFEILLIDAKKPFENNHCLPAGRLREKDYLRADAIVLTHADIVDLKTIENIKNKLLKNFDKNKIFAGRHKICGLFLNNLHEEELGSLKGKRFLVFAGIGMFDHFLDDMRRLCLKIDFMEFRDHHDYTKNDLRVILDTVKNKKLDGVITTQKDWVKIQSIVSCFEQSEKINFYISRVGFEFLTHSDHINFLNLLGSSLE